MHMRPVKEHVVLFAMLTVALSLHSVLVKTYLDRNRYAFSARNPYPALLNLTL